MTSPTLSSQLNFLRQKAITIQSINNGIERESLRVAENGYLSLAKHPRGLGSALTHQSITTDYSEALLEFITPVFQDTGELLKYLENLHCYSYQQIPSSEYLWSASMPCKLGDDSSIPIADYGSSNIGQMKHVYRKGLAVRYGKNMQTIAGIHFNFSMTDDFWHEYHLASKSPLSLQDFKSDAYLGLIRNFQHYSWIINYLFGASPALSRNFFQQENQELDSWQNDSYYLPHATTLRMSDIGYTNSAQQGLDIHYRCLKEYCKGLQQAIQRPHCPYRKIGVKDKQDEYQQLSDATLQIENEFYSNIRPKNIPINGEKPTEALLNRGIEYIEVRTLDINPFLPLGINKEQIDFLNAFLVYCLLLPAPTNEISTHCAKVNHDRIIKSGRSKELSIISQNCQEESFAEAIDQFLTEFTEVCSYLDEGQNEQKYTEAMKSFSPLFSAPEKTPSARILQEMSAHQEEHFGFAKRWSLKHREYFLEQELKPEHKKELQDQASDSLKKQSQLEEQEEIPFELFLKQYFSPQT